MFDRNSFTTPRIRRPHRIRGVVKEFRSNIEYPAQLPQSAGADPVGGALIFLHLLKGETEFSPEFLLTHPEHLAPQTDARADMHIDRMRRFRFATAGPPRLSVRCHTRPRAKEERKRDTAY